MSASARKELRDVRQVARLSTGPQFELREVPNGAGGTNLRFTGFASVTDAGYEMEDRFGPWIETVAQGAFAKTLSEGADVSFLVNHDGITLARTKSGTLKLSEVTRSADSPIPGVTGLYSEALLDPANPAVQGVRSAVERGDLDEMSFAFLVVRQEWNKDYTDRQILEVNLNKGDVSLVNYGANPHTAETVDLRNRRRGERSRRAAGDNCNRCTGTGTITLNGQIITCPQCGGTGTGEGNAIAASAASPDRNRLRLLNARFGHRRGERIHD